MSDSEPLDLLAHEIALNDPRTETVCRARVVRYLALVCDECRLILERETFQGIPPEKPPEVTKQHYTHAHRSGPPVICDGETATWRVVFVD